MQQITTTTQGTTKKNILFRISDVPGGVSLVLSNLIAGNVVEEGTPLTAPSSGKRTVCKQAKILTGSTTDVFRVETGKHHFKVGDYLMRISGGLAYAITAVAVDPDSAGYDTITVGTALESATVGGFIYEAAALSSTTTSALKNAADAILKSHFVVPSNTTVIQFSDALLRADVVENSIGSLYRATLPGVIEVKY